MTAISATHVHGAVSRAEVIWVKGLVEGEGVDRVVGHKREVRQ